ncbi:MAG: hypothetical protein GF308_07225 [Candidatus Heimdallarchaeota archaeon]|nr:hypothetical protein [Candidatus Heimdallarchaeota archaeon]
MGKQFFEPTTLSFPREKVQFQFQVLTQQQKLQLKIHNGDDQPKKPRYSL